MKTLLALAVLPLTALAAAFTPTARAQTAYQRTWTATANADWRAPSDADGAASWVAWGTGVAQTTTGDRFVLAGATGYSINIPAETTIALVGDLAFADNTNYDVMRYLRSTAEDGKAGLNVTTNTAGAKWVVTGGGTLHTGDAHPRGYAILLTAGQPQTLSIKTKITGAGGIAVANGGANGTKTADDTSQWVLDLAGDISEWTGRLTNCANRNIRLSGNVTALNAAATVWLGKFWNGDNNGSERQYGGYYTLLIDALDADFTFAAPVSAATTNGNSNSDGGIYINAGAHTVTLAHTQNNAATTIAGGTVAAASDANLTTNPTFRLGNARLLFSAAVPTSYARAITLTAPATLASAATDGDFHTYAGALTGNHALAFEGNLALNTSLPAGYTAAVSVAAGGTLRPLRADALSLAAPLNVAAGGALALAGDVAHALPETGIAAGGALVAGAMASGGSSGNTLRASSETVTFGVAAGKVVTLAAGAKIRVNAGAAGTTTTFAVAGGNGAGLALPAASGGNGGTTGTTGGAALTVEFPEAFAAATPDAPAGDVVLRGFSAAQRSALLAAPLVNAPAGAVFIEVGAGDAALLAAGLQAGDLVLAAFPLNITTPPPELVAATIGDAVALNAVATGEGLSCRWQFSADGSEGSFADITGGSVGVGGAGGGVTGSASASLAIAAATPAHAGFYRLVVSDRFGRSATTGVVTLTVAVPSFSIAANGQPQSVAALAPHGSAAFSVVANITGGGTAGDGSALRFQWQWFDEGAGAWRDVADDAAAGVSGASTATLTFADALPAQAGRYRVVVTNAHSAAWPQYAPAQTSAEATLAFALPAVVFAAQPAGASARLLGTVAFAALATGDTSGG
ncbi:MAG: hypothetical protein LBR07_06135, partial [Puniceicoccales bacterium]|nr:hypothetical protein [Puniceicoccales bacterium]